MTPAPAGQPQSLPTATATNAAVLPTVATFGEILVRLATPHHLRLEQAHQFEVSFAGSEANVAVSLAQFSVPARFISRLPDNPLATAALRVVRGLGVDTTRVVRGGDRIGVYFVEAGIAQRPSQVLYDRDGSAFATIAPGMVNWADALDGCSWFHTSGISPAVSQSAAAVTEEAVAAAKAAGLSVSIDLNHRAKLWQWGRSAEAVMTGLVSMADVVFCNETDLEAVFGIPVPAATTGNAEVSPTAYEPACRALQERFPNVRVVAVTLRGALSASENLWSAVLATEDAFFTTARFRITPILDRVGTGDAFAGAAISQLVDKPQRYQEALDFAVAASCLSHSVQGDFNRVSKAEVLRLVKGDTTGRILR